MRSRVTELLRETPFGRRSSSDFSFRRRGNVAYLSGLQPVGLFSKMIGPTLVLMTKFSGVDEPARWPRELPPEPRPPIDGHRPSSVVGVMPGVRPRVTDGVRLNEVARWKLTIVESRNPVGNESGFVGRRIDDDRVNVAVRLNVSALVDADLSRDLARSRVAKFGGPTHLPWTCARFADAARDRDRATEFSDFLALLPHGGSVSPTFFLAFDERFVGAPLTDELSLPPSLVQSLFKLLNLTLVLSGLQSKSEQKLNMLELQEAFPPFGASNPPQLLAYPALLLLRARCKAPTLTRSVAPVSTPLSFPSHAIFDRGSIDNPFRRLVTASQSPSGMVASSAVTGGQSQEAIDEQSQFWTVNDESKDVLDVSDALCCVTSLSSVPGVINKSS